MGFVLITESMSFVPADYGIQANTPVNVIAVGSGAGGSSKKDGGYGGASGRAGYNGGGGGGGGFGGGGGGAGNSSDYFSGKGGGAGAVKHKSMFFTDVNSAIAVTIGQPVACDTNGEASSFGSYLTAAGGEINKGSAADSSSSEILGGSGGGGGFQLGYFLYGCRGGIDFYVDRTEHPATLDGRGTGGGAGRRPSNSSKVFHTGLGGNGGGGNGGVTESYSAQDGYNHFGLPGQGCVLIFW